MYKPTIGMEIHAELKTTGKMFSDAVNKFSKIPNENVNYIDLALPGTLPKLNFEAIEMALKAALALNCQINEIMHFDRKNYFYPDLPKGYQITQSETPIGYNGFVEIEIDGVKKRINIERVHIEEDTCKTIHDDDYIYLDFNRSGVPLIEIVTKPDIKTAKEAILYLEKIKEILFYIGVSDMKMEEGSMRCEANVSVSLDEKLGEKVEIKNIGSISNVKTAIDYEIKRQEKLLLAGRKVEMSTRKFDESQKETVLLRTKESKNDYRYFPEPDLPYIRLTQSFIEEVKQQLPLLPQQLRVEYQKLGINENISNSLLSNKTLNDFFLSVYQEVDAKQAAIILTSDVLSFLNKNKNDLSLKKLLKKDFIKLVNLKTDAKISSVSLSKIINKLMLGDDFEKALEECMTATIDNSKLETIIDDLVANNLVEKEKYLNGDERMLKFFMGQIMKETKGNADPKMALEILVSKLK